MRTIVWTTIFKKDFKRVKKRGLDLQKLKSVLILLRENEVLPEKFKDHTLRGEYSYARECHIAPDWLLIYEYKENTLILRRTGTHSDLFR